MDENKRIKILAGVAGLGLLGTLYLYSGDIVKIFSSSSNEELVFETKEKPKAEKIVQKEIKEQTKEQKEEKRESKITEKPKKVSEDIFTDINQREKEIKNSNSIGELSDLKNQASIYKAKAEMMREQVLYETEKQKLMALLNPVKIETKVEKDVDIEKSNTETELLKLIEAQQKEIEGLKNVPVQNSVTETPVKKNPQTEPIAAPVLSGVQILSTQKINGTYSALITVDGQRMKIKKGDLINNDKVVSITKDVIKMNSGKQYKF